MLGRTAVVVAPRTRPAGTRASNSATTTHHRRENMPAIEANRHNHRQRKHSNRLHLVLAGYGVRLRGRLRGRSLI
jgi:hypothetical protein